MKKQEKQFELITLLQTIGDTYIEVNNDFYVGGNTIEFNDGEVGGYPVKKMTVLKNELVIETEEWDIKEAIFICNLITNFINNDDNTSDYDVACGRVSNTDEFFRFPSCYARFGVWWSIFIGMFSNAFGNFKRIGIKLDNKEKCYIIKIYDK